MCGACLGLLISRLAVACTTTRIFEVEGRVATYGRRYQLIRTYQAARTLAAARSSTDLALSLTADAICLDAGYTVVAHGFRHI